jgi:CheY-like chemotaxis protein
MHHRPWFKPRSAEEQSPRNVADQQKLLYINAMAKSGPIIIVEDDKDDQDTLRDALRELGTPNKLIFFDKCITALEYLKTTTEQPFIILSDVNLPAMSGLEFKRKIDGDPELRQKSIPFVFLSTAAQKEVVNEAFTTLTVQGFFKKGDSLNKVKTELSLMLDYWKSSRHPNTE